MNEIRSILREKTSAAHAKLDSALVKYDLKTQHGLGSYLCVHMLARRWIGASSTNFSELIDNPQKLQDLEADLEVLGADLPAPKMPYFDIIHPLGLTYVIAGSSLGSKLLYKNWFSSEDHVVQRANKFLTSSKESADWANFLVRTDRLKLTQTELDDVVMTADTVFSIYETANNIISQDINDHSK